MEHYKFVVGVPSIEEYRRLRVPAEMSEKSVESAEAGLPNTIFGVMILRNGALVGMGRIVGDGGLFSKW